MTEHAPELDATEARQGVLAHRVYKILVVSLALVVIAFAGLLVGFNERLSGHGGQSSAPSEAVRSTATPGPG
jgi:hypothetical protein